MARFKLGKSKKNTADGDFRDLGFGTQIGSHNQRLLNADGSFNVRRTGGGIGAIHPFHFLINVPWWKFWLMILLTYTVLNCFFACLYMIAGTEYLTGAPQAGFFPKFAHAFYFSVQTFTTVGYGTISPMNDATSLISSFEAMLGLMGFALATGVLYGRFSKPTAKIKFSTKAIVGPYKNMNGFMVRIVNRRQNQLIEVSAELFMVWYEASDELERRQRFQKLPLERDSISLFPLNWTIVHPINEESPLLGKDLETLEKLNAEFLILIKGFDDTFSQVVHARRSYKCKELNWGAKFKSVYHTNDRGITILEIDKIDECSYAELNLDENATLGIKDGQ